MAEVLVSVLLERLAMLSHEKIERELKMVTGVKQEIENLTLKFEAIQAVLEDAEQRQEMEASVKRWLNQLNDVSFDMDNVLDEWITRVLMHQLEKQERQSVKKVCFPFPSSCLGKVNQLFLRLEIAKKIKELNEKLAVIDQNKQSFSFQSTTRPFPQLVERQKTTSLPNVKTFGRDKERNIIVSKLISASSQAKEVPLIIPIVGMGGMGKTTLAQLVYNDENVKSHFDKRIWVCVSDPFEEIKIAQAIIEELDKNNTSKNSKVLQELMTCIAKLLEGKTFLLVLDDVWNPRSSQWEELLKPLQYGAGGSRILVTTRNEKVATLMKATTQMIPLKELGYAICLSLFYYNADMDESSVSKEFKDIGLEIVRRCNGLPLVAKTLGSLMRNKKTVQEWRAVLNSKTWELKEMQQDVFRPLLLSYQDLTPAIKRCLLYCVIFPKDYVYDRDTLIELWMSQDYLNAKENREKMMVGQNYFDDLAMRSFFQDLKENDDRIQCKIHDIIHDFLQYLTRDECVILYGGERKEVSNNKIRHLTVADEIESDSLRHFLLSYRSLRTVVDTSDSTSPMMELIVELKSLRTLMLWHTSLENFPERVGELIHLRYLDLSNNDELKELPHAVGSLYNLQTLRVNFCRSLTAIDVGRLHNLQTLRLDGCWSLTTIDVGRLHNLQTLSLDKCESLTAIDVGRLHNLQTLRLIGCSSLTAIGDVGRLHNLQTLRLDGCSSLTAIDVGRLQNLQTLRLDGCESLTAIGDVGRLINLRHLSVGYCPRLKLIKGIEKLTELQTLDEFCVSGAGGDEENKLEHLKDLNQLQGSLTIKIRGNPNVAENAAIMVNKARLLEMNLVFNYGQESQQSIEIMNGLEPHPALESLYISGHRGDAFSDWISFLHCLRSLNLEDCRECKMLPALGRLASLETLQIESSDEVSKVGVEFLGIEQGQPSSSSTFISFPKLRELTFDDMGGWEEWEGVEEEENSDKKKKNITIMPCLSELTISECCELKALPDFLWKTPLQKLHIEFSPILENLYGKETGEQWAKISHIPNIDID